MFMHALQEFKVQTRTYSAERAFGTAFILWAIIVASVLSGTPKKSYVFY